MIRLVAFHDNGVKLEPGELLVTPKGDEVFYKYATAATSPGKAGKVLVYDKDPDNGFELYASLFNVRVEEVVDVNSLEYQYDQADAELREAILSLDIARAKDILTKRDKIGRQIARRDGSNTRCREEGHDYGETKHEVVSVCVRCGTKRDKSSGRSIYTYPWVTKNS